MELERSAVQIRRIEIEIEISLEPLRLSGDDFEIGFYSFSLIFAISAAEHRRLAELERRDCARGFQREPAMPRVGQPHTGREVEERLAGKNHDK